MLTGKLVRLRPIEPTDLDRYLEWINDDEVVEFLELRTPVSRTQEEAFIVEAMQQTAPPRMTLAIELLEGGVHIGSVNLHASSNSIAVRRLVS